MQVEANAAAQDAPASANDGVAADVEGGGAASDES